MKQFNITGKCIPERHYMVDISDRIERIISGVGNGCYFCINRGRQYGKTTTLSLLNQSLKKDYASFFISFESYGESQFSSIERALSTVIKAVFATTLFKSDTGLDEECLRMLKDAAEKETYGVEDFKLLVNTICFKNSKPLVLIIDEVDNAGRFQPFVQFLAILRDLYQFRDERPTFQSVLLAGVYDVRNLKLKIRSSEEHQTNSPWNIAMPFEEDLSLDRDGIAGMLQEYADDNMINIPTKELAQLLVEYTSGYPYMVSRLCLLMEKTGNWNDQSLLDATKKLYEESNTLFSDTLKKLDDFPKLREMLYRILFCGEEYPYNISNKEQELAQLFDLIANKDGKLAVSNRIYETWLYNKFIADEKISETIYDEAVKDKPQFIQGGKLNMPLILERFSKTYTDLYKNRTEKFDEDEGRKKFIFFMKPIINGIGNYYVESRTRGLRRTDLIIDYLGHQYIIELKIWHGEQYNKEGEQQLADYLDSHDQDTGYLLTFNFNKKKKQSLQTKQIKGKTIIEVVV